MSHEWSKTKLLGHYIPYCLKCGIRYNHPLVSQPCKPRKDKQ